jgi:arsenate reductase-like glutaredoxin family protein
VDAKAGLGRDDALELVAAASKLVVSKGRKVVTFDLKKDRPDDDTLLAQMLGPTGKLRAPTIRKGGTLLVGFSEDTYAGVL